MQPNTIEWFYFVNIIYWLGKSMVASSNFWFWRLNFLSELRDKLEHLDINIRLIKWKYIIHYMKDKLKSVEYFILCLLQYSTLPFIIALFELIVKSAFCALWNFYGSRRRFPPRTEFVSARSPNPYPQYKVKNVRNNNLYCIHIKELIRYLLFTTPLYEFPL